MPVKGKYLIPQHVYTPKEKRRPRTDDEITIFGVRPEPALKGTDACIFCEATKDKPRERSTYVYRFDANRHPFSCIIEEQP